jgi:CRP-like cAMP-binding protein
MLRILMYQEVGFWRPEDMLLLACPEDKFPQYFYGNEYRYKLVAAKTPGEIVGETALLESLPRTATVCALNEVRCLTIDKETFQKYMGEARARQQDRVRFFQTKFQELSKRNLSNFHCMFEHLLFTRGQTIFLEGDLASWFYILEAGRVDIYSFKNPPPPPVRPLLREQEHAKQPILAPFINMGTKGIYSYDKPIEPSKVHPVNFNKGLLIASLMANSYFGEEAFLNASITNSRDMVSYSFTAIAMQEDTRVYRLERSKFVVMESVIGKFAYNQMKKQGNVSLVKCRCVTTFILTRSLSQQQIR